MPDSGFVFPPAFRVVSEAIAAVDGGSLEFFAAGTTTPATVYSNRGLTVSLGSIVYLDSAGHPVASPGSSTKVMVFTGTAAIKMVVKDSGGVTLATYDDFACAQVSGDGSGSAMGLPVDELAVTSYIADSDDYGRLKEIDLAGGSCTFVLPAASGAPSGTIIGVKRKGVANSLTVVATGSDRVAGAGSIALVADGDALMFASNGGDAWTLWAGARPSVLSGAITSDLLDARIVGGLAQVGDMKMVADEVVPAGWLECNGAAVSRTTYAALFAKIGTAWGTGDGATTFHLPDFRGHVPRGWDNGAGRDPNTATLTVTGAANNGSGLIRLTMASTSTLATGMRVTVRNVGGVPNATGNWNITVISATTVDLIGSTFAGTYTSGGTLNARYALNTGGVVGDRVGSYQSDLLRAHTHADNTVTSSTAGGGGSAQATVQGTALVTTGSTGGLETRMANAGVMFVICASPSAAAGGADVVNTVLSGSGAPSNAIGVNGDFYVDTTNSRWYLPKAAGAWGSFVSLIGPQGPAGTSSLGAPLATTLANGDNNNVAIESSGVTRNRLRVAGPTGSYAITGIAAATDGHQLEIYATVAQTVTIRNESASSTAANRIITMTGADVALTGPSIARLTYDATDARWHLVGTQG